MTISFLVLSVSHVDILINCLFPLQLSTQSETLLLCTCYRATEQPKLYYGRFQLTKTIQMFS